MISASVDIDKGRARPRRLTSRKFLNASRHRVILCSAEPKGTGTCGLKGILFSPTLTRRWCKLRKLLRGRGTSESGSDAEFPIHAAVTQNPAHQLRINSDMTSGACIPLLRALVARRFNSSRISSSVRSISRTRLTSSTGATKPELQGPCAGRPDER